MSQHVETQHVAPNIVAICCVGMLRSFGRGFTVTQNYCVTLKIREYANLVGPERSRTLGSKVYKIIGVVFRWFSLGCLENNLVTQ